MKSYIYNILGASLAAGLMLSCQSDELAGGTGDAYIQISSVNVDKTLTTRAEGSEQIAVDILNEDGSTFKHADDWTALQGQTFLVQAGTKYTVKAYSFGKTVSQGFDAVPVYSGEKELTVKAGVNQTVDVTCKLAQSMVSVSYSDKFKQHFSDYSAKVYGGESYFLSFGKDETRSAYLKAGQKLTIDLTVAQKVFNQTITESALPAYRYKVNYDVNTTGTGSIDISVDQNRQEYEITLGVPLKADGVTTVPIAGDASKVWGQFAILDGISSFADATSPVQFKYKKASEADWQTVAATKVGETTEYTARVQALDFGTEYQYKIVCGESEGSVESFTTESFEEIPNLNFDTWTKSGKNWYANSVADNYTADGAYWATGNEGVTSFLAGGHNPNTTPVEGAEARNGKAAKMETLTGVTLVGSAAGNLFVGKYKTNMNSPANSVSFGRPYSGARPVKLTGYYKYTPKAINNGSYPGTLTKDECNIYVTVWDASGNQIGFGEFVGKEEVTSYKQFSFDITYSNPSAKAASITIVATSSHYGGHFEGSKVTGQVGGGSTLWVDDFELSYY